MDRLSSQSKSMPVSVAAGYSATGTWTSPKLIAPFQMLRGIDASLNRAHAERPPSRPVGHRECAQSRETGP